MKRCTWIPLRPRVAAILVSSTLLVSVPPTPGMAQVDSAVVRADTAGADPNPAAVDGSLIQGHAFVAEDDSPIAGAVVYVQGSALTTLTDQSGGFQLGPIASGIYRVALYHEALADWGWSEPPVQLVLVPSETTIQVDFVLSAGGAMVEVGGPGSESQPFELDPLVVSVRPTVYERAEREGARIDVVNRAEIAKRESSAAHVGDLLRGFASLRVSEPHPGAVCVETRRRTTDLGATELGGRTGVSVIESYRRVERSCPKMVQVYVDEVRVPLAEYLISGLRPHDVERIEYVNGVAAGARFGTGSAEGILLIYTRSPRAP